MIVIISIVIVIVVVIASPMSLNERERHHLYYMQNQQRVRERCREYARQKRRNEAKYSCPVPHCTRFPIWLSYKSNHEQSMRHQNALTLSNPSPSLHFQDIESNGHKVNIVVDPI